MNNKNNNLFLSFIDRVSNISSLQDVEIFFKISRNLEFAIKVLEDSYDVITINKTLDENKEYLELASAIIKAPEGYGIFRNNEIKLNKSLSTNTLVIEFHRKFLFRLWLGEFFNDLNLETHNIYIMLLSTENYPPIDFIVIDKSVNYQNMNLEELKYLTTKKNKNGMYLVYFIGCICVPELEMDPSLNSIVSNPLIFKKIVENSLNQIIILTKKALYIYTKDLKETKVKIFYQITDRD